MTGLAIFIAVCLTLGWGIATRSRVLNVGLMLLYAGWMVVGSAWVIKCRWNRRKNRQHDA